MQLTFETICGASFLFIGLFLLYAIATGSRSLRNYLVTRLLLTIPMIWVLVTVVFLVMRIIPGDPITSTIKPGENKERIEELKARVGVNDDPHIQYINFMGDILQGDLGTSINVEADKPVTEMIARRMPATLELVVPSIIIMLLFGILSGAYAAHRHKKAPDYTFRLIGIVFYSLPIFWVGLMLQVFVGIALDGALPTSKRISGQYSTLERQTGFLLIDTALEGNWDAFVNAASHMVLPTLTLSIALIGVFIRLTRSNMIEVLQEDYVTASRARGVPERRVVYRHALRNSFIPIMTLIGLQVAVLLGGAVLTETTFSWPGMGKLIRDGIAQRDYPVVQGAVTVFAISVGIVSTLTDMVYAFIDPRIRY